MKILHSDTSVVEPFAPAAQLGRRAAKSQLPMSEAVPAPQVPSSPPAPQRHARLPYDEPHRIHPEQHRTDNNIPPEPRHHHPHSAVSAHQHSRAQVSGPASSPPPPPVPALPRHRYGYDHHYHHPYAIPPRHEYVAPYPARRRSGEAEEGLFVTPGPEDHRDYAYSHSHNCSHNTNTNATRPDACGQQRAQTVLSDVWHNPEYETDKEDAGAGGGGGRKGKGKPVGSCNGSGSRRRNRRGGGGGGGERE